MTRPARARALLAAAAVVVVAAAAWASLRREARRGSDRGFVDATADSGIEFRMSFLAGEQGENFKINFYDHGAGVAVCDVDLDGDDDVYFCNQLGANALYRNDGGGKFTDVTEKAGVALADRICVAAVFGDVDGDGRPDLYVTSTRGGNVLFRNRADGTFEDVTHAAGLDLVAHSQAPTFFDADGDGHLDLFVSNTAKWTTDEFAEAGRYFVGPRRLLDLVHGVPESNRFYRGRGDGTFEDATEASGLAGPGWGGDVAVFDADDDGDLDLFVANMFGRSHLYANDGAARFYDVTEATLGRMSWGTVGARVFDYDGDGRLDLFLVDMHSDMWMDPSYRPPADEPGRKFRTPWGPMLDRGAVPPDVVNVFADAFEADIERVLFGNTLFRNLGGGRYEETSGRAGVETLWPWGIATGDFDADGFEDAYLPSGMGYPYVYWPSPLLMNDGDGTFTDRAADAGLEPPVGGTVQEERIGGQEATRSSRCAATADFDGDGRLDLIVNRFNDRPMLLLNRWPKRHHVAFRLTGTASGREAVGATVTLRVGDRTLVRLVSSSGGYLAQSSRTLHFGLGDATRVEACVIRWPSGRTQTLEDVRVDAVNDVVEPAR